MSPVRSVAGVCFTILAIWVMFATSGCAWLDVHQRELIYRPTPLSSTQAPTMQAGDERFFLEVTGTPGPQRLELWWLPHRNPTAPTLLYLHGTFRNLPQNLHKINALREAGFAILAVDYRGWGLSSRITPSEHSILQDAQLAWTEMQRREPRAAQRVIYGHSMGSGVAVDLARGLRSPQDYGGLILESAFTSFPDVAAQAGWVANMFSRFSDERFASIDKITQVRAPLLMIHGDQDKTVPIILGKKLFDAANPPKQWQTIEGGGHSDVNRTGKDTYQAALADFTTRYLSQPE